MSQEPREIDPDAIRVMQIFDEGKRLAGEGDVQFLAWLAGTKRLRFDPSNLSRFRRGTRPIPFRMIRYMREYLATDPGCASQARALGRYVSASVDMAATTFEGVADDDEGGGFVEPSNPPGFDSGPHLSVQRGGRR